MTNNKQATQVIEILTDALEKVKALGQESAEEAADHQEFREQLKEMSGEIQKMKEAVIG